MARPGVRDTGRGLCRWLCVWRFLRHVPDEGIPGRELQKRLCLPRKEMQIWATRMGKWWRYVTLDANGIVRFTAAGGKANAVWGSLVGEIEERWERRFGARTIDELRQALEGIVSRLDADLPDCLPIVGYGLFSKVSAVSHSGQLCFTGAAFEGAAAVCSGF